MLFCLVGLKNKKAEPIIWFGKYPILIDRNQWNVMGQSGFSITFYYFAINICLIFTNRFLHL